MVRRGGDWRVGKGAHCFADTSAQQIAVLTASLGINVKLVPFAAVIYVYALGYVFGQLARTLAYSFTAGIADANARAVAQALVTASRNPPLYAKAVQLHADLSEGFAPFAIAVVVATVCNVDPNYCARYAFSSSAGLRGHRG